MGSDRLFEPLDEDELDELVDEELEDELLLDEELLDELLEELDELLEELEDELDELLDEVLSPPQATKLEINRNNTILGIGFIIFGPRLIFILFDLFIV